MVKRTSTEKFVDYVNRNIGKPLQTRSISTRTRLGLRRVQMFCKSVRERSPRKVSWASTTGKRAITYTFKRNITSSDLG